MLPAMRITLFSPGVTPPKCYGGTERVVYWLAQALAGMNHEVALLAPTGSRAPSGVDLTEIPLPPLNVNELPLDLTPLLAPDTDILHVHCASPVRYALPCLKTVHGYPFYRTGDKAYGLPEQFGPGYSFLSDSHRRECGLPDNPFVHNGLDLTEYEFRETKEDYFLFLGKVDWNTKGLPFALRLAKEKGLKLKIAGDFLDPTFYERELKPELGNGIEYVGPVGGRDKAELLAGAKALLHPVLWPEPFGLAVIEALASGTPVLATHNGATPEIMVQGVTGFMGRSHQETLAQLPLLDSIDPHACRARVETLFTSRHMAQNYLRLYLNTIKYFHLS
jgi:glycosyltransferase involved in cell wall biosynthesis